MFVNNLAELRTLAVYLPGGQSVHSQLPACSPAAGPAVHGASADPGALTVRRHRHRSVQRSRQGSPQVRPVISGCSRGHLWWSLPQRPKVTCLLLKRSVGVVLLELWVFFYGLECCQKSERCAQMCFFLRFFFVVTDSKISFLISSEFNNFASINNRFETHFLCLKSVFASTSRNMNFVQVFDIFRGWGQQVARFPPDLPHPRRKKAAGSANVNRQWRGQVIFEVRSVTGQSSTLAARNGSDQKGTTYFWPHSFNATLIGLMLKYRIQGGTVPPYPPPPPFRRLCSQNERASSFMFPMACFFCCFNEEFCRY